MSDPNRQRVVRRALESVAEGLEFAAAQAGEGAWRWVAISTCMALQGALVAALSGYETADPAAVAHPDDPARVASISTLLRRAASTDYLADPERLSGLTGARRQALALAELRNRAVHMALDGQPAPMEDVVKSLPGTLDLIRYLVLDHPAFEPEDGAPYTSRIIAALARLSL